MNLIKSAAFGDFIVFQGASRENWTIDEVAKMAIK